MAVVKEEINPCSKKPFTTGEIFTIKNGCQVQCKVERVEAGVVYFKTLTGSIQVDGALNIETLEKLIEEKPHAPDTNNAS